MTVKSTVELTVDMGDAGMEKESRLARDSVSAADGAGIVKFTSVDSFLGFFSRF